MISLTIGWITFYYITVETRDYEFRRTPWSHSYPVHYGEDYEDSEFELGALNRELELQEMKTHGIAPNAGTPEYQKRDDPNIELKYTNLSQESSVPKYNKRLQYSKVFKFTVSHDNVVNIILVSTTRRYHPQVIISEMNNEEYTELTTEKMSFNCTKGKSYIVEVGHDKQVNTDPFEDITSGGFTVVLTSTSEALKGVLLQESIKVGIWGYTGVVPFENNSALRLYHPTRAPVNHGHLNYNITPFYNDDNQSVTIYYHLGVDTFSGDQKRSASLEITCNKNAKGLSDTFYGSEPSTTKYEYKVESSRICDVINQIK